MEYNPIAWTSLCGINFDLLQCQYVLAALSLLDLQLIRRHFPLKLAFAMTINKSEGQTLNRVGIYLPTPLFSHSQLYVALSRVLSFSGLRVLLCNKRGVLVDVTKKVVYRDVLNHSEIIISYSLFVLCITFQMLG